MTFKEWIDELRTNDEIYIPGGDNPYVDATWTTGGVTGASCWGGTADQPVRADDEPELDMLDKILEVTAPEISFLLYKRILAMTTVEPGGYHDYYGNCHYSKTKTLKLKDVYDFLVKHNLIAV